MEPQSGRRRLHLQLFDSSLCLYLQMGLRKWLTMTTTFSSSNAVPTVCTFIYRLDYKREGQEADALRQILSVTKERHAPLSTDLEYTGSSYDAHAEAVRAPHCMFHLQIKISTLTHSLTHPYNNTRAHTRAHTHTHTAFNY